MDGTLPENIISITYSSEQAHQLFAGSDLFLMPYFEPCGQSQIYSMRYGTIPLAHSVGGLLIQYNPIPREEVPAFIQAFHYRCLHLCSSIALKRMINHGAGSL